MNQTPEAPAPETTAEGTPPITSEAPKAPEPAAEFKPIDATAFKLPEGAELPEADMKELVSITNEAKVAPDVAQKFLDLGARLLKSQAEAATQQWATTNEKWQTEIKNDPAFAGTKLTESLAGISRVFDQYGDPGLRAALDLTGAGNHPAIFRTFDKIARALSEGKPVVGSPPSPSVTLAERMYPTQAKG